MRPCFCLRCQAAPDSAANSVSPVTDAVGCRVSQRAVGARRNGSLSQQSPGTGRRLDCRIREVELFTAMESGEIETELIAPSARQGRTLVASTINPMSCCKLNCHKLSRAYQRRPNSHLRVVASPAVAFRWRFSGWWDTWRWVSGWWNCGVAKVWEQVVSSDKAVVVRRVWRRL